MLCGYSEDVNYVTVLAPCMSSQAQPQKGDESSWEVLVSSELRGNIFVSTRNITSLSHDVFDCKLFRGVSALSKIDSV